jgi:hypothetical protein
MCREHIQVLTGTCPNCGRRQQFLTRRHCTRIDPQTNERISVCPTCDYSCVSGIQKLPRDPFLIFVAMLGFPCDSWRGVTTGNVREEIDDDEVEEFLKLIELKALMA